MPQDGTALSEPKRSSERAGDIALGRWNCCLEVHSAREVRRYRRRKGASCSMGSTAANPRRAQLDEVNPVEKEIDRVLAAAMAPLDNYRARSQSHESFRCDPRPRIAVDSDSGQSLGLGKIRRHNHRSRHKQIDHRALASAIEKPLARAGHD